MPGAGMRQRLLTRDELGKRIRLYREQSGLSQSQLGVRIHSDGTYISKLERGLFYPKIKTLVLLAEAVRCEITDLIF